MDLGRTELLEAGMTVVAQVEDQRLAGQRRQAVQVVQQTHVQAAYVVQPGVGDDHLRGQIEHGAELHLHQHPLLGAVGAVGQPGAEADTEPQEGRVQEH